MACFGDGESLIRDLTQEFSVAVARSIPREIAALMCADEAQSFLDNVSDPDSYGPAQGIEVPTVEVLGVRVFGDVGLARFTRRSDDVRTLYFRWEDGRWRVCADAEDDFSLEQLEDNVWPAVPADASHQVRVVHDLRRKPIGSLGVEDLRVLLLRNEGLDVLLPPTMVRLQWDPLLYGDLFPGDLLVATLQIHHGYWANDPVSLTRMRIVIDKVRNLGDLTEHAAPHDEIWNLISEFLTDFAD